MALDARDQRRGRQTSGGVTSFRPLDALSMRAARAAWVMWPVGINFRPLDACTQLRGCHTAVGIDFLASAAWVMWPLGMRFRPLDAYTQLRGIHVCDT